MSIQISSDAPRVEVTIQGLTFTMPQPFSEGHTLRANEANALNQTFVENIRNNFASTVKDALEAAATNETSVDADALQEILEDYMASYDFGVRRSGTRVADPVEREALAMAEEAVKNSLRKGGYNLKDVGTAKIKELAKDALESYPAIREKAAEIVAQRSAVASIGELSI